MPIYNIEPNVDHTGDWSVEPAAASNHYGLVTDSTDGTFIYGSDADDYDIDEFGLTTRTISGTINQCTAHWKVLCLTTGVSGYEAFGNFYDGSSWQGEREISGNILEYVWSTGSWSGLSMEQTDVDNCRLKVTLQEMTKVDYQITEIYVELSGIEAATAGWTGKFMGVTDPAKIMGIPVANVKSIMGVE